MSDRIVMLIDHAVVTIGVVLTFWRTIHAHRTTTKRLIEIETRVNGKTPEHPTSNGDDR